MSHYFCPYNINWVDYAVYVLVKWFNPENSVARWQKIANDFVFLHFSGSFKSTLLINTVNTTLLECTNWCLCTKCSLWLKCFTYEMQSYDMLNVIIELRFMKHFTTIRTVRWPGNFMPHKNGMCDLFFTLMKIMAQQPLVIEMSRLRHSVSL